MTAPVDNPDMRLPSHQRTHVSRRVVLRAALAGAIAALTLVPAGEAAASARGDVFVSKGVGRQIFEGGSGVAYGTLYSGASLIVIDYSATHDLKVEAPVTPTANADGSRTYVPAGGSKSTAYRISGSVYRLVVTGSSTFNASGVYGRLQLRGKGTLVINGRKNRWNGPAIKLSDPPKAVRPLYRLAVAGTPPPVTTPVAPPTTPVTTTTTSTAPSSG
jgi:hypothetical protein